MATEQKAGTHHPDVQRDFETCTVNPGPGMAGPVDSAHNVASEPMKHDADKDGGGQCHTNKSSDKGGCGCG